MLGRHRDSQPISLRRSLLLLVAVCVVPAVTLGIFGVYDSYRLYKRQIYSETQRLAENLVAQVDRELAGVESGLRVLATSEALRAGDLKRFHRIARDAVKSQIVYNYVLVDRQGAQVINTLVPFGQPLPRTGTPPQLAGVIREGRTVLTDYFIGPVTGKPAIAMGLPIRDDEGDVAYSLNIGLAPEELTRLLMRQKLPEGWLAALVDTSGTIVGRTVDAARLVGTRTSPDLYAQIRAHRNGTLETQTRDGMPVVTAYATSPSWGWAVAVGAPKRLLETQLTNALLTVVLTTSGVLMVAGWIALSIVRHLTRSVEVLHEAAKAINDGKPVDLPDIQLVEADAIGRAIAEASRLSSQYHYRAYHDTLTDLGNRTLFHEFLERRLARARRGGEPFSLLMIDLDHFKELNDRHGHGAGDTVLRAVAQRIRAEIRAEDLAARLGGDEFAVLLGESGREDAMEIARRLNASIGHPYANCDTRITASIGVVTWRDGIKDGAAMLELADRTLYRVKDGGRDAVLDAAA